MKHSKREIQTQKRECVFQQLFMSSFYAQGDKSSQLTVFLEDAPLLDELELGLIEEMTPEEREELKTRCEKIFACLPELDRQINDVSEGWKTNRMSRVDLSLIRLALYEMQFDDEIPLKVAINEAVELAKKYGGDDSPAFVNAILGKLAAPLIKEKDAPDGEALSSPASGEARDAD